MSHVNRIPRYKIDADALAECTGKFLSMGYKQKPGKENRVKLEGHCLFHDDQGRPNADFYPDDGWYKCWACDADHQFIDNAVAEALGVEVKKVRAARLTAKEFHESIVPAGTLRTHTYYEPDGSPQFRKLRLDNPKQKFTTEYPTARADGSNATAE
jgi:hypothetical protein